MNILKNKMKNIQKISGKFMSLVFLLCYIKKMVATIKNHNIY